MDLVKQRERGRIRERWGRDGGMEGGGARLFTPVCVWRRLAVRSRAVERMLDAQTEIHSVSH